VFSIKCDLKEFTVHKNNLMIEEINKFKPDVIFVGMTCPSRRDGCIKRKMKSF
jgi:UDP-N-acetyl-D-mannosaminuronic acid transferase (WecB/TagA/CpsF family)